MTCSRQRTCPVEGAAHGLEHGLVVKGDWMLGLLFPVPVQDLVDRSGAVEERSALPRGKLSFPARVAGPSRVIECIVDSSEHFTPTATDQLCPRNRQPGLGQSRLVAHALEKR